MKVRFGEVTFDGGRRALCRGPAAVHVTPKAFQLLELLLSRRPEAVAKADIQEALWPRAYVSETNLPGLVKELRHAIGDDAHESVFIRTVHGFGYAFEGPVHDEWKPGAAARQHLLFWGAATFELLEGANIVGRRATAEVWVSHPSVSREHARITVAGKDARVEDLESRNGTWIGSSRVTAPVLLPDGANLRVGTVVLVYRRDLDKTSTESAS